MVYAIWELFELNISFERELIIYSAVTVFVFVIGYKGLKQGPIFMANLNSDITRRPTINGSQLKKEEDQRAFVDQNKTEQDAVTTTDVNEVHDKSEASDPLAQESIDKLLDHMEHKKPYLEDKLMLSHIAQAIDIPHFKLSKIINDNFETNFFNFVNGYRVDKVKKMLSDQKNDQFTILALAYDCGFSSKASFNRIFKKMTNMTPSEYQRSCRANMMN